MNVVLDTLSYMSKLDRMNYLVYKKVEPYLGKRILEAGCGNGNLTAYLLEKELVVAVDNDEAMLREIKGRFLRCPNIRINNYDLANLPVKEVSAHNFDTIICSNTLEHIQDDTAVLNNFHSVLGGGNLIIVVPTLKFLYCSLDKAAGHYRRYSLKELSSRVEQAGFTVVESMHANFFGIIGWFFNGKLLRKKSLSRRLLNLFNFLTPAFELFEKLTGPPLGLSLILVCRKRMHK